MVSKILGYILFGVGVIGAALSYSPIRKIVGIPNLPSPIGASDGLYLLIGSAALLLVGAFLAFRDFRSQPQEVPIYKGKEIVGYRRMN